ncbi:MAG: head-tail adaptor protein [Plesiomonas shigelloides]
MFDPARLNKRLRFERWQQAVDNFSSPNWVLLLDGVLGEVRPIASREQHVADQSAAVLTHAVRVRYHPNLLGAESAQWRIVYTDRAGHVHRYAIEGPVRELGRQYLLFACIEGLSDAR